MNDGVINILQKTDFQVLDSSGVPVTGLLDVNFTKYLYDPEGDEVSGVTTVTITELGTGNYRASWTPDEATYWKLSVLYDGVYYNGDYWIKRAEFFDSGVDPVAVTTLNSDMVSVAGLATESNATLNKDEIIVEVDENETKIDAVQIDTTLIRLAATGHIKIDTTANTLTIYDDADNELLVADLFNAVGNAASGDPSLLLYAFERKPQ